MSPPSDQDSRPRNADAARPDTSAELPAVTVGVVLPAEWVAPSIARDRIRPWLAAHQWSPAHLEDLVLAISEAVSNCVEHGYGMSADGTATALSPTPGTIEVTGRVLTDPDGRRRAEFTIRDQGRWLPPAAVRGNRGHGMAIMRACADEVTVESTAGGTTVVLRSRPLPRPPGPRVRGEHRHGEV